MTDTDDPGRAVILPFLRRLRAPADPADHERTIEIPVRELIGILTEFATNTQAYVEAATNLLAIEKAILQGDAARVRFEDGSGVALTQSRETALVMIDNLKQLLAHYQKIADSGPGAF